MKTVVLQPMAWDFAIFIYYYVILRMIVIKIYKYQATVSVNVNGMVLVLNEWVLSIEEIW